MFRKKVKGNPDLSFNFKDEALWKPDLYERFPVASVTAIAYDRSLSIYVCGLSNGEVHLYGSAPVHHVFVSPDTVPVNHLQIVPTAKRVVGIASNRLVVWSLEGKLTAKALSSVEIPSGTVFLGTSSRHSHAFIPYSDGTIVTFDLSRLSMSPSKVIPSPSLSDDVVMDLAHNIHNLDELLVATYASIYVWHFTSKIYGRTFNLPDQVPLHPVCLSMHPQESVFVAGTLDGRLVFWNISETEPLWVTTISELVGELKEDQVEERSLEPIFKLSWTLSDSGSSLTILGGRGGNQSRLTTLGFSSTSFLTLDQLVPEKTVIHDPSLCEDISDFVVITREKRILTLQKNSTVVIFGSEDRVDNGEASPGPLEEPFIPYQFRSSILAGYVLECSSDIPPQFIQFNDVTSIATGGLAISKDGPDSRLSKLK
ncbi:hypothetical protein FRC20_000693 [Serendipita sp. 405]|nr:hypothetical protein FRC20_000693 [Serendipita sp. 405]